MQKIPMTAEGATQLRTELDNLKNVERRQIIAAIAEARAHGDLKENAEYHAAKERQSFIEGRIQEIESKLSHAQIIDVTKFPNNGKVIFGSTVHLMNLQTEKETRYRIVGEDEANIKNGMIFVSSPIARALISKLEGDTVGVQTPSGIVDYEIMKVEYI